MKYLIVALLLLGAIAYGQFTVSVGPGKTQKSAIRKPNYHNHPDAPLLFEDFENPTGYDLPGWSEVVAGIGVINEDYTSTVLYGTQSLFIDEDADDPVYTTNSFSANGHVWMSFLLRITAVTTPPTQDQPIIKLTDSSNNSQVMLTYNGDGELKIKIGTSFTPSFQPGFGPSLNKTYYVWIEYWKDNGTTGYVSLGYSLGPIKPRNSENFVEGTFTSTATDVSRVQIGRNNAEVSLDVDFIMDHLIIDNKVITDYP